MGVIKDISLDKAELLAIFLEAVLYGVEALIFVATVYLLHGAKRTTPIFFKFSAVIGIFLLNTIHIGSTFRRVLNAFVGTTNDPIPDAAMYLADLAGFLYRFKNILVLVQFFMLDILVVYRCYLIWDKKLLATILPSVSIVAFIITGGIASFYAFATDKPTTAFTGSTRSWVSAALSVALITKLVNFAIVFAATIIPRPDSPWQSVYLRANNHTTLYKCLLLGIESGGVAVLGALILIPVYLSGRNSQGIMLAAMSPLTGQAFLIIVFATLLGLTPSISGPSRRRKGGFPHQRITLPPISVSPVSSPTSRFSAGSFVKGKVSLSSKSSGSPRDSPDSDSVPRRFSKIIEGKTTEPSLAYTDSRYLGGYVRGEPLPFSTTFTQREPEHELANSDSLYTSGDTDSLHISVSSRYEANNNISRTSTPTSGRGVFSHGRSTDGTT